MDRKCIIRIITLLMVIMPFVSGNGMKQVHAETVTVSATFTKAGDSYKLTGIDNDVEAKRVKYIKVNPESTGIYRIYSLTESSFIHVFADQVDNKNSIGAANSKKGVVLLLNAGATYYVMAGFDYQSGKGDITVCMDADSGVSVTSYDIVDGKKVQRIISGEDSVTGLSWNADTNTLTMNGYNGGGIYVERIVENTFLDVNIVISGINTIDMTKGRYNNSGLSVDSSCIITGSGELSITNDIKDSTVNDAISAYSILINGPTIRIENTLEGFVARGESPKYGFNEPNGLTIMSGTFIMNLVPFTSTPKDSTKDICYEYGAAVYARSDLEITGGNYYINYIYDDTEYNDIEMSSSTRLGVFVNSSGKLNVGGNTGIYVSANEKLSEFPTFNCIDTTYKAKVDETSVKIDRKFVTGSGKNTALDINIFEAELSQDSFVYDGKEKKPAASISGLWEETDYDVTYADNKNAGTATVMITGKGLFTGTKKLNFTITQADLSKLSAKLSQTTYTYDGTEKKPEVVISGLNAGTDYQVTYTDNKEAGIAAVTVTGINNYKGSQTLKYMIAKSGDVVDETTQIVYGPKVGTTFKAGSYKYKITKQADRSGGIGEVAVACATSKKIKNVKIGATVKKDGLTYNIVSVSSKAFSKCSKLTKVTVGANVTSIGDSAFAGCKKLTTVKINSKVLKSIGKSAFSGDKKLKTFNIKSAKLTKVGKKAFKGISGKATFKVPKNKLKKYKSLIKKAGAGKKVKCKKL